MSPAGTVALVVRFDGSTPVLLDVFSDDIEIHVLEKAVQDGSQDPIQAVYESRVNQEREEEEFGDYVETLITHPGVRPEIREHGVQWLRSKVKIDEYKKHESDASHVIADYAFKVFEKDPTKAEFLLAGPTAEVRIRVFVVAAEGSRPGSSRMAA
ncbi:MAG TPA: hypothetical protein VL588_03655 [Bdellovibrionota bacterium]|nr:hypothetical protein [Bdellovibrionota bacterium]